MDLKMNLGDAAIDAVMGYAIVFLGIALLVLVVVLMGRIMSRKKPAPAAPAAERQPVPAPAPVPGASPAPELPAAPGSAGEVKLYDVPDKDAAMIMAIVADELKIPLNELRFISIREVNKK